MTSIYGLLQLGGRASKIVKGDGEKDVGRGRKIFGSGRGNEHRPRSNPGWDETGNTTQVSASNINSNGKGRRASKVREPGESFLAMN